MLINLSNHPSKQWSKLQTDEAVNEYGKILDLPFPAINPSAKPEEIKELAKYYFNKCLDILKKSRENNNVVHIMGELTFCFALVNLLQAQDISCISSTSARNVVQNGSKKIVEFNFVQFREYL